MSKAYQHLLEPIMVGKHLYKSRLVATPSPPSHIQQGEPYPIEALMQHYANKAKGGAAVVMCSGTKIAQDPSMLPPGLEHEFEFEYSGKVNHYLSQMVECIHNYRSFANIVEKHLYDTNNYDISDTRELVYPSPSDPPIRGKEMPVSMIHQSTEQLVERVLQLKNIGFDGVYLHMAYRTMLIARAMSPITNLRTDQYGGCFENRIRLALETCAMIKQACGNDFVIDACITGEERNPLTGQLIPGGWTIDDSIAFAKAADGLIDVLHIRGWDIDEQHPLGLFDDQPPYLRLAAAVKQGAPNMKVLTVSGHHNPADMDRAIADGQVDLIGMARGWITNPDFGTLVAQDRADDIVPCIRCNKCFRASASAPYTSRCSVNPLFGMEHRYKNLVDPPTAVRNVAVVGGGPAGMQLAKYLRQRGHAVTLFEKSQRLGGQLNVSDHISFKWPLRDFKDHLVHQMDKLGVDVRLNTQATPQLLNDQDFDLVFCTMGSRPIIPKIDGVEGQNVFTAVQAFEHQSELGHDVVVIGAGENGVETAMHLAMQGHQVTVLEALDQIAPEMSTMHYRSMMQKAWERLDNLRFVLNATVTSIDDGQVVYLDAQGVEHAVPAQSTILSVGSVALTQEAIQFARECDAEVQVVGDNCKPANVMELTRQAYFAASSV